MKMTAAISILARRRIIVADGKESNVRTESFQRTVHFTKKWFTLKQYENPRRPNHDT